MKEKIILIAIAFLLYVLLGHNPSYLSSYTGSGYTNDQILTDAYQKKQSDVQVSGSGVVVHKFPDDISGRKHQKFILKLLSGQTVIVSHNIDLARPIDSLKQGDTVSFYGEYEWKAKGGVVHWTHHDPRGKHIDGWLKHNGATYQ